jgi:hypothetical protein
MSDAKQPAWTPGPYAARIWHERAEIIPAEHTSRQSGGSVFEHIDIAEYAQRVAWVEQDRHGRGDYIATANLLAAAPDMYEALKSLSLFSGSFADPEDRDRLFDMFAAGRAALSKEEGRS